MLSLMPSALALGLAALAAVVLARTRESPLERAAERKAASRALAVAVGAQGVHFAEEVATGFHEKRETLPDLLSCFSSISWSTPFDRLRAGCSGEIPSLLFTFWRTTKNTKAPRPPNLKRNGLLGESMNHENGKTPLDLLS